MMPLLNHWTWAWSWSLMTPHFSPSQPQWLTNTKENTKYDTCRKTKKFSPIFTNQIVVGRILRWLQRCFLMYTWHNPQVYEYYGFYSHNHIMCYGVADLIICLLIKEIPGMRKTWYEGQSPLLALKTEKTTWWKMQIASRSWGQTRIW